MSLTVADATSQSSVRAVTHGRRPRQCVVVVLTMVIVFQWSVRDFSVCECVCSVVMIELSVLLSSMSSQSSDDEAAAALRWHR